MRGEEHGAGVPGAGHHRDAVLQVKAVCAALGCARPAALTTRT